MSKIIGVKTSWAGPNPINCSYSSTMVLEDGTEIQGRTGSGKAAFEAERKDKSFIGKTRGEYLEERQNEEKGE